MEDLNFSIKLLRFIRKWQRSNKAIGSLTDEKISLNEIIILLELEKKLLASSIAQSMNINKSTVSRILAKLKQKKYLKFYKSEKDSRSINIELTSKSLELIKELDLHFDTSLIKIFNSLTHKELIKLNLFLNHLCDNAQISQGQIRKNEHILRNTQRRIAKLIGVPNNEFIGNKISILEWHILSELLENNGVYSNLDLERILFVNKSVLSIILKKMVKNKLIVLNKKTKKNCLTLTEYGHNFLNKIEENAGRIINKYCANLYNKSLDKILELVIFDFDLNSWKLNSNFVLKKITSLDQKNKLREKVITRIVELGLQKIMPETIIGVNQQIYAVYSEKNEVLILQFDLSKNILELNFYIPLTNYKTTKLMPIVFKKLSEINTELELVKKFSL